MTDFFWCYFLALLISKLIINLAASANRIKLNFINEFDKIGSIAYILYVLLFFPPTFSQCPWLTPLPSVYLLKNKLISPEIDSEFVLACQERIIKNTHINALQNGGFADRQIYVL